jgi:hypothetical protein
MKKKREMPCRKSKYNSSFQLLFYAANFVIRSIHNSKYNEEETG